MKEKARKKLIIKVTLLHYFVKRYFEKLRKVTFKII